MRVKDVMTTQVVTTTPDVPVKKAAAVLGERGFTALPVVDEDDELIGIVTEADLMRDRFPRDTTFLAARPEEKAATLGGGTVGEVMTSPATAMGAEADVVDVVRVMLDDGIRSMPIVDGAKLRGIVTRRDLVRALGREDEALARDIRHRLAFFGGSDRWTVRVDDGEATITDTFDIEADRRVATVLAESVPGVVHAYCHAIDSDRAHSEG